MLLVVTRNKKKIAAVAAGIVAICLALFAAVAVFSLQPLDKRADNKRLITIPDGASTKEIAVVLRQEQVIRNPWIFRMLTRWKHFDNKLQAGEYELSTAMTLPQILHKIAEGDTLSYVFTIPEGYTVEQIAALLSAEGLVNHDRFLELARKGLPPYESLEGHNPAVAYALEGLLFPDTYKIPQGMKEEEILAMMLRKFALTVTEDMRAQAAAEGLNMHQLVTLASLVEREAKVERERPIIAAVFLHRIKIDMPIQSCATIQYILGTPKQELSIQDTQIESPYNTYLHAGLPPGPIANPGLASIQAVLNPANTDVLYFVAKPDGTHIFSRTYEEHVLAIEQVDMMAVNKI